MSPPDAAGCLSRWNWVEIAGGHGRWRRVANSAVPLLVKPSFSILSSYCLARRRCTWRVHNLEEEPRRRGIWIRHRGIQIVVAEPWHSGRPHAQARSLTSATNVFEWWLGRGVSPWDEGDVAMVAEWGSQKHVGHDSWCYLLILPTSNIRIPHA